MHAFIANTICMHIHTPSIQRIWWTYVYWHSICLLSYFFCFGIFVRFNVIVEISLFFASCVVGVVFVVALRHVSHELMTSKKLCWKKLNPSILAMKEELIFWEKYFSGIFWSTFCFSFLFAAHFSADRTNHVLFHSLFCSVIWHIHLTVNHY